MKSVVAKGKTVEEAIKNALDELGADAENVTTKVLEIPDTGIMGVFGNRYAKVEVTLNDDDSDDGNKAEQFLSQLLEAMDIKAEITTRYEDDIMLIDIDCKDTGILIGRRGQTLDSIQYLTSLAVNKGKHEYTRISLDVSNYREKRKYALQDLADKLALKVEKTKTKYELEPMNSYERRIIHSALQNYPHVSTYSVGEEPNRHVVIDYKI